MKTISIQGKFRTEIGKKHANRLRSELQLPGVIYGGKNIVNFSCHLSSVKPLIYTADFSIVEIQLEKKTYKCVLKDIQFDKISDQVIHVDFQELVDDKPIKVELPIHFEGNPEGVKKGGKFIKKIKNLKIKTLPKYLKEAITVDVENLDLEQNIRVEDLKEDNIEILNSPRIPIASVTLTRVLKQIDEDEVDTAEKEEADEQATDSEKS